MGDRKCEVCRKYGSCYASDCPDKPPASPFPPELVERALARARADIDDCDDSAFADVVGVTLTVVAEWMRSDVADERGAAELFRRTGIALVPGDMRAVLAAALEGAK